MSLNDIKKSLLRGIGNIILPALITLWCKSLKVETVNGSAVNELLTAKKNFVLAFWHGVMLVPWFVHRNRGFQALISQSKDGELLSRILHRWKYRVVRGSSSRGGKAALNTLVELLQQDGPVAITPDGPRGPEREFKAGAVIAAQRGNVPLVLAGAGYKKCFRLKSWDKFAVPYPFTRVRIVYAEPVSISPEGSREYVGDLMRNSASELNRVQYVSEQFA